MVDTAAKREVPITGSLVQRAVKKHRIGVVDVVSIDGRKCATMCRRTGKSVDILESMNAIPYINTLA